MEFGSEKFFYTETTDIDLSFLNPMVKRRLSNVDKITLFLLNKCNIDNKNIKIVYASRFGELERLIKLINQLLKLITQNKKLNRMPIFYCNISKRKIV